NPQKSITPDLGTAPDEYSGRLDDLLAEQQSMAKQTPWRSVNPVPDREPDFIKTVGVPTLQDEPVDTLSPAEQGMRFHAYMEHSDPTRIKGRGFLQRLLSSAIVREHELEIWSTSAEAKDNLQSRQGLVATRRKIIDLFCVVEARKFPEDLWNGPCLLKNEPQISTLKKQLEGLVAVSPQLHLVIDFKTGAPDLEHVEQMTEYLAWVKDILATHPGQLVNDTLQTTLFTDHVRPLVGMIYYTSPSQTANLHNFASALISIDKNASVLFVSPE
ncbi:hypothetical protein EBR21_12860, partial [bacterium]|nr:hypothetical protein [bacterium]